MVTIYCSRRLELFLRRPPEVAAESNDLEPTLGNWNAYTFRLSAKQCVIVVNSKTCYCVPRIFERHIPDINLWFEETLVQQLNNEFKLSETVEASIRSELAQIRICRSNNNRNVNAAVRGILGYLRFYIEEMKSFEPFDEPIIAVLLNYGPIEANVWARTNAECYSANDGMKELIEIYERAIKV